MSPVLRAVLTSAVIALLTVPYCSAWRYGLVDTRNGMARRVNEATKHLYCKLSGGCSQCQESEEIERYCADTGFKELLQCTTDDSQKGSFPVVLTYPYPPDVHIDDDRDESPAPGAGSIRVVRSCTEKTVVAHQQALAAEVAAAAAAGGGLVHMPLLKFELLMCGLLGLSLPVVYWRKIRIRHL